MLLGCKIICDSTKKDHVLGYKKQTKQTLKDLLRKLKKKAIIEKKYFFKNQYNYSC